MVQVGGDGMLSLIAGDSTGMVVWRTGINAKTERFRRGIKSKTLTQAAKVLKGRGVTVDLMTDMSSLTVRTSQGGSIVLPFTDPPALQANRPTENYVEFAWNASEFDALLDGIGASHAKSYPNGLVVEPLRSGFYRFASTDRYKIWQGKRNSLGGHHLTEPIVVSASFWNALRASKNNAVTRFSESGVKVHIDQFEFSTGVLGDHPIWPNYEEKFFKEGTTSDVNAWFDRKGLIGAVKAILPAGQPEATTIAIAFTDSKKGIVESVTTKETVTTQSLRGSGSGHIECSGKFLLEILNAISDESVIVSWNNTANYPIRVVGSVNLWSHFILAPVVRV